MVGRRVTTNGPLDMARLSRWNRFAQRRVIRDGQLYAAGDSVWNPVMVTSQGSYSTLDKTHLSNVTNVANVQIGSLVAGIGVGREVYVRTVDLLVKNHSFTAILCGGRHPRIYIYEVSISA